MHQRCPSPHHRRSTGGYFQDLGELITLLEADKRYCGKHEIMIPYPKRAYAVPPNLYIIGTMNTADKSIALIDVALRRRFGFIELMPDYEALKRNLMSEDTDLQEIYSLSVDLLSSINQKITTLYDRDHQIGHSYLMRMSEAADAEEATELLIFTWYHEIIPLLQEYFYDAPAKLRRFSAKSSWKSRVGRSGSKRFWAMTSFRHAPGSPREPEQNQPVDC